MAFLLSLLPQLENCLLSAPTFHSKLSTGYHRGRQYTAGILYTVSTQSIPRTGGVTYMTHRKRPGRVAQ